MKKKGRKYLGILVAVVLVTGMLPAAAYADAAPMAFESVEEGTHEYAGAGAENSVAAPPAADDRMIVEPAADDRMIVEPAAVESSANEPALNELSEEEAETGQSEGSEEEAETGYSKEEEAPEVSLQAEDPFSGVSVEEPNDQEEEIILEEEYGEEEMPAAMASSGSCGENVTWALWNTSNGDQLVFSGTGDMYDYSNDDPPFFEHHDSVKFVVFEHGITSIGAGAFYGFSSLEDVTFSNSVKSIGERAFYDCGALKSITMRDSVETIGERAFSGCSSLSSITIPEQVTNIGDYTFSGCSSLGKITIPSGVTHIGAFAFNSCTLLKKIVFECDAPSIGGDAFYNVTAEAYYPPFDGWTSAVMQSYGGNITWICNNKCGDNVYWAINGDVMTLSGTGKMWTYDYTLPPYFSYRKNIKKIVIQNGVTNIGTGAFDAFRSLTEITIPNTVTAIENSALAECESLKRITIPDSVTQIGSYAFYECSALESITIPNGVAKIAMHTFEKCTSLKSIVIPDSVTEIGSWAFKECTSLSSITIPENVAEILTLAFDECIGLQDIIFKGNAPLISLAAFSNVIATAYYPSEDATWTSSKRKNYGGQLTWVEYDKIKLSETEVFLPCGTNKVLAVISDGPPIQPTWSSSDEDVAEVDENGIVTAKKVGTAVITASSGSFVETCEVHVQFTDVTDTSLFYYNYIYEMVGKGVVAGFDDNTFRPLGNCNRAAVVTFLWRLDGKPEPGSMATFKDMTGNPEFNKAISWAAEKGITTGWDDNTFRPWQTCNRAAIVTFLWRYAGKPESETMATFKDMTGNAEFNKAISWAAEKGITTGWDDNTFRPWNTCTRLAVVSFLCRYDALSKA